MILLHITIWKEEKRKGYQGLEEEVQESTKLFFIY